MHLREMGVAMEWLMSWCGPEREHNEDDVLQLGEVDDGMDETPAVLQSTFEVLAVLMGTAEEMAATVEVLTVLEGTVEALDVLQGTVGKLI